MLEFQEFTLTNGLHVIIHEDKTTPLAHINILYKVGSKDENEEKTGFAHLFEHLMFGGSKNIPDFDKEIQRVGGENNAFTSTDITNYYITLPAENIETGLWLESDRMLSLDFSPTSLEVQRKVVIEEFKQRYLNQPYGDAILTLRPLSYKKHAYRWPTIGKDISHIEEATMEDVISFYQRYYNPDNAILCIAGNVSTSDILPKVEKWFGDIPRGKTLTREYATEPRQTRARKTTIEADVPLDAIYKVFHIAPRNSEGYDAADFISDILSASNSSRLYRELVDREQIFSSINAYVSGEMHPGILTISGQLQNGRCMEVAEEKINEQIALLSSTKVTDYEMEKNINKYEAGLTFSSVSALNNAMSLCYHAALGNTNGINEEFARYSAINSPIINRYAKEIFRKGNSATLYYYSTQKKR